MVLFFQTFKCSLGRTRVVLVSLCVVTLLSLFCGKISENSAKNGTLVSDIQMFTWSNVCYLSILKNCGKISEISAKNGTLVSNI